MRPKGSSVQLEQRRRDAMAMLKRGMRPTAVAKVLGVALVSVCRWQKAKEIGGAQALAAKPVPGRPLKLGLEDRKKIVRLLAEGPLAHGFRTELWTLGRIAEVIDRHFGVEYHPSQVWRILISLGWSCQKPESRARERNEAAVARWRRVDWPRIKKSRQIRAKRVVSG